MLTNGLVSYLLAVPAVTVIVGSAIQPVPAPEDLSQYPLITYQTPSDVSEDGNDGPIGVSEARVVFDCFALRKLDAATLALTVKAALRGFSGVLPDGTRVFFCRIENVTENFDDGSRIYRSSAHFIVQYAD